MSVRHTEISMEAEVGGKAMLGRAAGDVYRLKITLMGSEPPIWRRVLVPGGTTLAELHMIIQVAMGWENDHLHLFRDGKRSYGPRSSWEDMLDEEKVCLRDIAPQARAKFGYEYDMGDSWRHTIKVEAIKRATDDFKGVECLDGARACPPEDCGGLPGYEDKLVALKDPRNEDHAETVEWMGEDFDPEAFDLAEVNRWLGLKK